MGKKYAGWELIDLCKNGHSIPKWSQVVEGFTKPANEQNINILKSVVLTKQNINIEYKYNINTEY